MKQEEYSAICQKVSNAFSNRAENQEMHIIVETQVETFDIPFEYFHPIIEEGLVQIKACSEWLKIPFEDIVMIDFWFSDISKAPSENAM